MRSSLALVTLTAGLVLPTGVAVASTVSVPSPGGAAVYQAAPRASDLTSRFDFSIGVQFKDAAQAISPGAGCVAGPPVTCAATAEDLRFGDKADRFRGAARVPITISAGGGKDTIRTAGEYNIVSAGDGNDSVWENGNSLGSVNGDAGADKLFTYEAAARLHGGSGDDLLVNGSTSFGHQLSGDTGNDELVAIGSGSGTAAGGDGADVIVIDTHSGGYTIDGGSGADTIKGGPSFDTITAGGGNDVIDVTGDGVGDDVTCGSGWDTVYANAEDTVANDCERVYDSTPTLPAVDDARADAAAFVAAMPDIPVF